MRARSSTTKRLLTLLTAISVMTLCAAPSVYAVAPYTTYLPTFSGEVLTPASQTTNMAAAWTNIAPNALASYYTFVPYTPANALIAGFPAALNCGVAGAGGSDCYTITVKQAVHSTALPAIFPGGTGLLGADGTTSAGILPTTFWGYGSGGANWVVPGGTGTVTAGNAPAPFTDGTFDTLGIWHWPAPTIKATANRPVHVRWVNELPNVKPQGFDPSVDCGSVASNCYPYNRIVTHVHGAHVTPESDGLATAWYSAAGALFGEGKFAPALYVNPAQVNSPIYSYPMTQEAATVWYHDHAVGTTHLNTNNGMAGFFTVTDPVEAALQVGAPPILPSGNFELGFALQDRNFDVTGQMVMPDFAIYDKNDPNCVFDLNNNAIPGTCARLQWMKKINPVSATDPTPAVHLVPYVVTAPEVTLPADPSYALNFPAGCTVNLTNPFEGISGYAPVTGLPITFTQCAPFPATSATLEYFGNIPLVNGVNNAVYDVTPTIYRMRFIGGSDSRTWIAQLVKQGAVVTPTACGTPPIPGGCAVYAPADIIPFWQIGSEQGLLTNPVSRTEIDIMPGERYDVLVDFTGLGGTTVTMMNLGDDAPYSGFFDFATLATRQPTSVDIPEIMKFRVSAGVVPASAVTPSAATVLRPAYTPLTVANTRVVSLMEITDQYGRTMPTIDSRGYIPPGIRTTEVIKLNSVEQWDIVNTTVDAHPMHIHQVAFQTINRQPIAVDAFGAALPSGFKAPGNYPVTTPLPDGNRAAGVFSAAQYVPIGIATAAPAYELGWKDTVQCPPGYVTRVKANFDLLGDYVWHCHILSHEEHDMMRPFRVVATQLATPASLTVAAVADVNSNVSVTVAPVAGAVQYVVQYRKVGAPFWETNNASTATQSVSLLASGTGTYEFRAQAVEPAVQSVASTKADSAWVAGANTSVNSNNLEITPAGAIGNTPLPTYTWSQDLAATSYNFYLRNAANAAVLNVPAVAATCAAGTCTYTPATSLPTDSYVWYVQAVHVAGALPWGVGKAFNVQLGTPSVAVVLGAPVGAIGNTPLPTYTWAQDLTATSYNFYLRNAANAAVLNVPAVPATCVAGTCSYTPATSLRTDSYVWYVQPVRPAGVGPWGTGQAFSVAVPAVPGAVTKTSPTGAVAVALPTFTWTQDQTASSYNFYLVYPGGAARSIPAAAVTCSAGSCSYTLTAPALTNGAYTWYAQAVNTTGTGSWGTGQAFSVSLPVIPGAVTKIAPTGAGVAALPTYSWTQDVTATSYNFYLVYPSGAAQSIPNVAASCTAGTCTFTQPAPALPVGAFTWFVQAVNSAGTGTWGTGMAFSRP